MNFINHKRTYKINIIQRKRIFWLLLLSLTLPIANCSTAKTDNTISDDQFIDILARMMIIEQFKIGQTEKITLTKELFKSFNTTREIFTAYRKTYENDTQHWIYIYKETENRIKSISSKRDLFKNNLTRDIDAYRH
jgi:hypothetical protein